MRCLWLWLLATCALQAEGVAVAVAVDHPIGGKAGRHGHLQHVVRHSPPPAPAEAAGSSKLRHRGAGHSVSSANARSQHATEEKFPKLKELGRRLEKMRTTSTTRAPYFFAGRTKHRPRWKYARDYEEHAARVDVEDVDEEYDAEDEDADDVDETQLSRTTSTTEATRTTPRQSATAYEDEPPDDDTNDDYYDDEIFAEDTLRPQHDVQAEEGLHEQSPMTQYKWRNYGTREALEESRWRSDAGNNDRKKVRAANEHYLHMKSAAKCRLPRARVINVHEVHQLPGKAFRPHCTVLHRCGEDTGCCQGQGKKCRAKTQEIIHLYFYVFSTTFGQAQQSVERLAFHNHTECACLDDAELKVSQRIVRSRGHYGHNNLPPERPSCKCPEEFIPAMSHRFGHCVCDCPAGADAHSGCSNMKRGKEHLSLRDRKCILDEKCTPPTCEYGAYVKLKGRCPRRHETVAPHHFDIHSNNSGSNSHAGNTLTGRSDSDYDDYSTED